MNLGDLAAHLGGTLTGNPQHIVTGVRSLANATPDTLTFVLSNASIADSNIHRATAAIVHRPIDGIPHQICVKNPRRAMAEVIQLFHPVAVTEGISPQASVHPSARIGTNVLISPGCVIGEDAQIGNGTIIYPNVTIYPRVIIGDRVIIHAGSVIGSDGFGYYFDSGTWGKIPHIGRVVIGNDVEIGSNCTIDRGVLDDTLIGNGTKIDNLCHIAHNTRIGDHCAIAGQSGTTGSATLGNGVQVGGQTGIADITVGDFSVIAGKSGVTHSIPPQSFVSGFPAWDHRKELKKEAWIRHQFAKRKDKKNEKAG